MNLQTEKVMLRDIILVSFLRTILTFKNKLNVSFLDEERVHGLVLLFLNIIIIINVMRCLLVILHIPHVDLEIDGLFCSLQRSKTVYI